MKPFRLALIFVALFFVSPHADAQRNWWRYGVDEMIVIPVKQQPRILDSLGQTFFISETEYGAILINKVPEERRYYSKEDLEQFKEALLQGMTMSGEIELISHYLDTIKSVPCVRFTFRKRSQNLEGQGIGFIAGDHAYGVQFVNTPENAANANEEREYFFTNLEFSVMATTAHADAGSIGYRIGMGIGLLAMIMVPAGVIALIVLGIRSYRKRRKSA
jgi:hypothetical protein